MTISFTIYTFSKIRLFLKFLKKKKLNNAFRSTRCQFTDRLCYYELNSFASTVISNSVLGYNITLPFVNIKHIKFLIFCKSYQQNLAVEIVHGEDKVNKKKFFRFILYFSFSCPLSTWSLKSNRCCIIFVYLCYCFL